MMNKKGAELSITVIVVIILALLVLIVVALIFLSGSTGLMQRLKNIFLPQQAIAVDLARQNCNQWCSLAESMSPEDARKSAFCTSYQEGVDVDRDGKPDRDPEDEDKLIRYYCSAESRHKESDSPVTHHLGVSCSVSC